MHSCDGESWLIESSSLKLTKHGSDPSPRGKPPFSTDVLSKFTLVFLHPGDYERYATGGVFSGSRKVTTTRERFIQENEVVRFTSFGIFRKNTSWYWRWSPFGQTRYAMDNLWSKRWRARTRWVNAFYSAFQNPVEKTFVEFYPNLHKQNLMW